MEALRRGLGETANNNSTAFGFSLTIGGTGLILADLHGSPAVGEVFLLIAGPAVAMIMISALSTSGFRTHTAEPLPERRDDPRTRSAEVLGLLVALRPSTRDRRASSDRR